MGDELGLVGVLGPVADCVDCSLVPPHCFLWISCPLRRFLPSRANLSRRWAQLVCMWLVLHTHLCLLHVDIYGSPRALPPHFSWVPCPAADIRRYHSLRTIVLHHPAAPLLRSFAEVLVDVPQV